MTSGTMTTNPEAGPEPAADAVRADPPERRGIAIPDGVNRLVLGPNLAVPRLATPLLRPDSQGSYVAVRPISEEYGGKTFLGILLGDMDMRLSLRREGDTLVLDRAGMGNPCIFVPRMNQFVYGMESWWGILKSPDELRQITDDDIDNVWYVQALKSLSGEDSSGGDFSDRDPGEAESKDDGAGDGPRSW